MRPLFVLLAAIVLCGCAHDDTASLGPAQAVHQSCRQRASFDLPSLESWGTPVFRWSDGHIRIDSLEQDCQRQKSPIKTRIIHLDHVGLGGGATLSRTVLLQ